MASEPDGTQGAIRLGDDFEFEMQSRMLRRDGCVLRLQRIPLEVLAVLIEHRGEVVSRDQLAERIWGKGVFLDADNGLNIAIRKLRLGLGDNPERPHFIQTVTGQGYRLIAPVVDTDLGHKRAPLTPESLAPEPASGKPVSRRWQILVFAAILLMIAGGWVFWTRLRNHPQPAKWKLMVAVLPFQNLSGDPGQDFFVQGMTEEVITQLGQLNPERIGVVRSRSPSAERQTVSMIPDFGQQSGLQYLLEGSVRRQDEQARISVRMTRVADDTMVWTESFDRNVGDVLSLQSEIAQRVGRQLQVQVLGRINRSPVAPAAVEAYFKGRFEMERHIVPVPDVARVQFERAIALDSSYAPAYAGLADFYRSRGVGDSGDAEQDWRLAEQYASQALALDSESAETRAAIAQIKLMHDWDWHAAREHALRALQLNPSLPEAHSVYARYLSVVGNLGEAVSHRKQAVALDPLRVDLIVGLGREYYSARDYKSALASARLALTIDPNQASAQGGLCAYLGRLKVFDESIAECSKALVLEGHADWVPPYIQQYQEHGYQAADTFIARKYLDEILREPHPDLWDLANAYVSAGRPEDALRTLFQALQTHDPGLLQIRVDPDFDPIRNDPRYAELVRQIGFPTE